MLASPTVSATSRAGQPRPGAPAWAQPGAARVRTARALVATDLGGSGAHGSSVLGRAGRSSTLCLGWKLGVLGLRTQRRGAQLFPPDVGCPVRSFFLLPRGWQSAPHHHRGCSPRLGRSGRDSPPRVRVSPPCTDPGLCPLPPLLREPLQGSAACATGSSWRRRQRGSHGDWKGGDLQTLSSGRPGGGLG